MDFDGMYSANPGYGKSRFSRTELRDILISVAVLSLAFTIMYRGNSFVTGFMWKYGDAAMYAGLFGMSLALVTVSFLFYSDFVLLSVSTSFIWVIMLLRRSASS